MPDTTIHAASWLINPDAPLIAGGAILVRNGCIQATGTRDELKRQYAAPVVEHPDCAILPGFINAHTHLELTHFPSWRLRTHVDYNPRTFTDWIIQLIKICRGLHADDFRASLAEGMRKCAEAGTTSVGDIVTRYDLVPAAGVPPLGGRFFLEVLGNDPARFAHRLEQALETADRLEAEQLTPGLSPHSPYTIAETNMSLVRDAAITRALPQTVHLSESREETDFIHDTSGPLAEEFYPFVDWKQFLAPPRHCSSTELLDRHGLLTPATLAVHCVHVTLADARIIKDRGASICLCPRSNDCLDVGTAPVALFRKLAIPLALGTDSLASNGSLSMWDEMRFALDMFPKELSPADVFRMATTGGAAALRLSDSIGSLEAGKRADFQVVRNIGSGDNNLLERIIGQGRISGVTIKGISDSGCHPG
jgi:cytosine/adenosine deaminase-related metal-dependent hydrolase